MNSNGCGQVEGSSVEIFLTTRESPAVSLWILHGGFVRKNATLIYSYDRQAGTQACSPPSHINSGYYIYGFRGEQITP